jgi:type III secretory pathway lipoprotein EscJ
MANNISEAIETKDISAVNSVSSNAYVIVTTDPNGNAQTHNVSIHNLLANSTHDVKAANLYVTFNTTPANSTANCTRGQFWYDNNYFYVAVANNSIRRIAWTDITF